jgi:chemotaxis protein histidine kinase CheA
LPPLPPLQGILPPGTAEPSGGTSVSEVSTPGYQRIPDPDARKSAAPGPTAAARAHRAAAKPAAKAQAAEPTVPAVLRSSTDPPPRPPERRNIGLRGAAPWVARHAAKHAAELRARNAEPAPPGSARATLRIPPEAEQIKARVATLHQQTSRIRALSRRLDRNFYEVGEILAEIQRLELHVAKGYSSYEAFLDREIEIGRTTALRLIRIAHTFLRETAYDYGIEKLTTALAALDGELSQGSPSTPSSRSFSAPGLPARPPIRFGE